MITLAQLRKTAIIKTTAHTQTPTLLIKPHQGQENHIQSPGNTLISYTPTWL
jgi:hypothetical protein